MQWMILPYRRYADFEGRSGRREFWMFVLFNMLISIGLSIVAIAGGFANFDRSAPPLSAPLIIGFGLLAVFVLASFIPNVALQVRRFHDQDKSGWFLLLGLIPYAGGLIVLIFMCLEGTRGPNRFGADPRDPHGADVFG